MTEMPLRTQLDDGRHITVDEPPVPGAPDLEAASHGLHVICHAHLGGAGHVHAARIATADQGGEIIATGWVQHRPGETTGELCLSVHAAYQHDSALSTVLRELATAALGLGVQELTTCVPGTAADLRDLFHDAGLQVVSALPVGGMAEYRLRTEAKDL